MKHNIRKDRNITIWHIAFALCVVFCMLAVVFDVMFFIDVARERIKWHLLSLSMCQCALLMVPVMCMTYKY